AGDAPEPRIGHDPQDDRMSGGRRGRRRDRGHHRRPGSALGVGRDFYRARNRHGGGREMSEQMNAAHEGGQSADAPQADWQRGIEEDMLRNLAMPLMQLVRGEGSSVWDSEGNRYLDFLSGIAVLSLGHAHPVFVEAVSSQAATLA